ncbi:methionyl-tRNA formyltransferase [Oceanococcus atlanticus]|uniref:Methionyl-tRNA formyltransferase n=1 Tax=Oceanococcus atlanticus TaxID=1317117 RepID=A0A1Y1SBI6_9GAMM|nr:methionyl-tRNA formyltransferase [Oceanococcus atlanticus]ORE85504.1 methionyl-tRNA formyltransferase [Oceanococcus atlanticus]
MRIVFAGTPEFAARPLQALLGHDDLDVVAVYTQPDRPAGRGRKLSPSPVKQVALAHDLPVYQPPSLKQAEAQAELAALKPDLMVVIAYGLILPQAVLDIPARGCVNLHASLLPRWRGAAPIQRAIEAGDTRTGLCLMQMEAGLDTGPVLACESLEIDAHMTGGLLHDALMARGAQCLPGWLATLDQLQAQEQDDALATYAHKLSKDDGRLDFSRPATELALKLRAFDPWPGCFAALDGQAVKLAGLVEVLAHSEAAPGTIVEVSDTMTIACAQGALRLNQIQFPGARRMSVAEAARGRDLSERCFD